MLPEPYPIFNNFSGQRIHFGISGSISAYKIPDLIRLLHKSSIRTGCTLTRSGRDFVSPLVLSALGADPVFDQNNFDSVIHPFAHLSDRHKMDLFLVAPATANILAKTAAGIADDLLTCQILSSTGPVYFAPAMNPQMWDNFFTRRNVETIQNAGHRIVFPETGEVACGDTGTGRLASIVSLYFQCLRALCPQTFEGQKALVTAGPTHEYFDLVRYWGNPSSGRMGLAASLALWLHGAAVHFVHGPMQTLQVLPDFYLHPVTTAEEMYSACRKLWPECGYGVFAAAVADFAPESSPGGKFKKEGHEQIILNLHRTRDILAGLSRSRAEHQKIIGFAAEADDIINNARKKMQRKDLDLIVANLVTSETTPFGSAHNEVVLLDRLHREEKWPRLSKAEIAWKLVDRIAAL